jgi:O-succinylbenzoic acid--CoA ligase
VFVESWLARAARTRPDAVALETAEGRQSYAQLDAAATRAARHLGALGVRPGDRVALALPARAPFVEALHGCMRLGAAAVPVDLRLSEAERAARVEGCAVVVDRSLGVAEDGDGGEDPSGRGAEDPSERSVEDPSGRGGEDPCRRGGQDAVGGARGAEDPSGWGTHDLDATAIVVHTSGTTSAGRPVELTYGNWLWSALGSAVALGLDPDERWLCTLPLSHVGGLSILLRSAIYATTAVLHDGFDAATVVDELTRGHATLVSVVPTTLARLLDHGLCEPPALRGALVGGGPIPTALLDRARAAAVPTVTTYGLTEACSQVTTAGPPLFCTRVCTTADGEILVAGPTVAPAAAGPDGWLRTGDLGALDAHGHLTVTGRAADTIVTGGENVAPTEVEAVLATHPAVADVAVHGAPDADWGQRIVATIVLRPGTTATAHELTGYCRVRLARYKVPKVFRFSLDLPRTQSGKLLRRDLEE